MIFDSQLNLKLAPSTTEPGQNVSILIDSNPNSYVGLLGVDQSVLLLKRGNDFDAEKIFDQITDSGKSKSGPPVRSEPQYPTRVSYKNTFPDFETSETVIISNSKGEKEGE